MLSRADRFQLHIELGEWVSEMNDESDGGQSSAPPRTTRRTGVY